MLELLRKIDYSLLQLFHSFSNRQNDLFFSTITWLGSLWILAPLFLLFLLALFRAGLSYLMLPFIIGFTGAIGTTYAIKYLINRHRPEMYAAIGEMPFDPSFPSAHTTQAFIFLFLIIIALFFVDMSHKYLLILFLFLLALCVACSRIYLQVHYFSDTLAGFFVALLWGYISYYLSTK